MSTISGSALITSGGNLQAQNGLAVAAYARARFGSAPIYDSAVPDADPADATTTTGEGQGSEGAWHMDVASGDYWVVVTYSGHRIWELHTASSSGPHTVYNQIISVAEPNASSGVDGTAVDITLASGVRGIDIITEIALVWTSMSTESVQATLTATFDDATTNTMTSTRTTNGTNRLTGLDMTNLHKHGHYLTGLSINVRSSILSSTADVTMSMLALQQP